MVFFFFKQKTAYEMRISDWSSDVCSSDLGVIHIPDRGLPRMPGIVVEPIVAIARRATIIGLEHGIAAVDEELRQPIETPLVTRGGAAVWHDDRLKVLAVAARRKREIGGDRRTIRRRIADRRHLAERHTRKLWPPERNLPHVLHPLVDELKPA